MQVRTCAECEHTSETRSDGGRPFHEPTNSQRCLVYELTRAGTGQRELSKIMKMSHVTLRKYYRHELDTGKTMANLTVANALFLRGLPSVV